MISAETVRCAHEHGFTEDETIRVLDGLFALRGVMAMPRLPDTDAMKRMLVEMAFADRGLPCPEIIDYAA